MGITHAKVSTRPPSGDPDEISRDDWNDEHVVVGDFGGGIDFDQANEGTYLSVVTTGVATLILNDTSGDYGISGIAGDGRAVYLASDAEDSYLYLSKGSTDSSGLVALGNLNLQGAQVSARVSGVATLTLNDTGASFDATLVSSTGGIKLVGGAGQRLSMENDGTFVGWSPSEPLGFYGATPIVRPTVTGSTGGNAALASLLAALADLGLIVDSTT